MNDLHRGTMQAPFGDLESWPGSKPGRASPSLEPRKRSERFQMPRVFVVHKPNQSYSYKNAESLGEIVILFEGFVNFEDDQGNQSKVAHALEIMGFKEGDYLLNSGSKVLNAMAAVEAAKRVKQLNLLVFMANGEKYLRHTMAGMKG